MRYRVTFDTRADNRRPMRYNLSMPQVSNLSKESSNRVGNITKAIGLSAVLVGLGSLLVTGCAGDKDQDQSGGSQAGTVATSDVQSEGVIFGDECAARADIYQIGLLNVADGKGGLDQQRFDDLANNVIIKDGRSGIKAPVITSIPEDVLNQIRTSVTLIVADRELVPAVVNLYGEPQPDWDDYDGVLNSGLKACV